MQVKKNNKKKYYDVGFCFSFSKENHNLYNLDTGPVDASLELLFLEMMSDR